MKIKLDIKPPLSYHDRIMCMWIFWTDVSIEVYGFLTFYFPPLHGLLEESTCFSSVVNYSWTVDRIGVATLLLLLTEGTLCITCPGHQTVYAACRIMEMGMVYRAFSSPRICRLQLNRKGKMTISSLSFPLRNNEL